MSLEQILANAPVHSIDEALALMRAIEARLPDDDGIKWFNRLYLRVTVSVAAAVHAAQFRDPAFLVTLDLVFANLYFSALVAGLADIDSAPAAWRPLLRSRHTRGIARIQFALAGINAHINRDLPDGIVQSFRACGGNPITDVVRHEDFDRVNHLLAQVERDVKSEFGFGPRGELDRLAGSRDDALAMWSVRGARTAAWTNAQVLWGLGVLPSLRDRFFDSLDRFAGVTGRGLLIAGAV
jgi:hypothetical protein